MAGNTPLTVSFIDQSQSVSGDPIVSWQWQFGDGATSTRQNPRHTYLNAGEFTVTLTVTSASGTDDLVREGLVKVNNPTDFGSIGPSGGTVSANGVTVAVRPTALTREVTYGVARLDEDFGGSLPESGLLVSDVFKISHNNDVNRVFASALGTGNNVRPAGLVLPFTPSLVPPEDRTSEKLGILALLPSGRTLPLPVVVEGGFVAAEVAQLPPEARYVAVYRPGAFDSVVEVPLGSKAPTSFIWEEMWKAKLSNVMLEQLTALRLAEIDDPASFSRTGFSQGALDETETLVREAIERIHRTYATSDLRSPLLVARDDTYQLLLYNTQRQYPTDFESLVEVVFQDSLFGHLVLDPRQLLSIGIRNSKQFLEDPENNVDIGQKFSFDSAFAEGLFRASFRGYEFPPFPVPGLEEEVDAFDGIRDGTAVFMGRFLGGEETARSFGPNERLLLSEPLFAPFSPLVRGYSAAGQDFYWYIQGALELGESIGHITEGTPPVRGILEEIRFSIEDAASGRNDLSLGAVSSIVGEAADRALAAQTGVGLSEAYGQFAQDLAYENTQDAMLRPSDEARPMNAFAEQRFAEESLLRVDLMAPTDTIEVSANEFNTLRDIQPLTSRAILLGVNALTSTLTLTFNADEWQGDEQGDTVAVTVFQRGQPPLELAPGDDTLVLTDFMPDPQTCLDEILILMSNANAKASNNFAFTADAFSGLDVEEAQVLDQYVGACDPNFEFEVQSRTTLPGLGLNSTVVRMKSGAWRGPNDVDQVVWEHSLTVLTPTVITSNTALMVVAGGDIYDPPTITEASLLAPFSLATGSVVSLLQQVPNQPLEFAGEEQTRSEDDILAFSYDEYLEGFEAGMADKTWPALLPMTRAAVRGMTTVQDLLSSGEIGRAFEVSKFSNAPSRFSGESQVDQTQLCVSGIGTTFSVTSVITASVPQEPINNLQRS